MFLDSIVGYKYREIEERKLKVPLESLKERLCNLEPCRDFKLAISRTNKTSGCPIRLIAEIKQASPSGGILRRDFDPSYLANVYQRYGASAISVVTESGFFLGSVDMLSWVRKATTLPLLRKDFILDEYQIYETRVFGADAILLVVACLSFEKLTEFIALSKELGLTPVVEIHTEDELKQALRTEAEIIGINNRNLHTFEVDLATTFRLKALIPKQKVLISESGLKTRADVLILQEKGVDAVLIGETLLRSQDIGETMRQLLGISQNGYSLCHLSK